MTRCKNRTLVFTLLFGLFFWSESAIAKPIYLAQQSELSSTKAKRAEAERLFEEASEFYQQGTAISFQQAISSWNKALDLYRELGDRQKIADAITNIGGVYDSIENPKQALEHYNQALPVYQEIEDRKSEATVLSLVGNTYNKTGQTQKALEFYNQALLIRQKMGDRDGEAKSMANIAYIYDDMGLTKEALELYKYALLFFQENGEEKLEARILNNVGLVFSRNGEVSKALEYYNQALPIRQKIGDRLGEAITLGEIGAVYVDTGELEKALEYQNRSLLISQEIGDRRSQTITLNSLGVIYFNIGELEKASNYYNQALLISQEIGDISGQGYSLSNLAGIYLKTGKTREALNYFHKSWNFISSTGISIDKAVALNNLGFGYDKINQPYDAFSYYSQALQFYRKAGNLRGEATSWNNLGGLWDDFNKPEEGLEHYNNSLAINQKIGDRASEANNLGLIAILHRKQGDLIEAISNIKSSIDILEAIRGEIADSDLRTTYFASVNAYYKLYIDILMQLHQQNPSDGYDRQALEVSEQARSRTLLELIKEGDIYRGIDPQLKQRKEELEQQIITKTQAIQSLAKSGNEAQIAQIEPIKQKISQLENQLEALETEIRQQNPEYARLTQVRLNLNAQDIQEKIVDDDTVLLSYWLGEEQSYLWLVTPNEITSYTLPPQAEIEQASEELLDYAQDGGKWDLSPKKATAANQKLSQMLLSPIADRIGNKRLIVVADGGLQYLPFSLLENPQTQQSLVVSSEIVNLPSASTLDTIRNKNTQPPADRKEVAIFAHPVFTSDDPRLQNKSESTASDTSETLDDLVRKQALEEAILNPLPGTEATAQQILAYIPNSDRKKLNLGFEANRQAIFDPNVSQYRLIHLGTHGLFNKEKPEHSGIVLSLYDEQGNYQADGMLLITEVFNLNLPADLVVLAACNTVEGEEIKGEGVVGITRGLMYAGASRVVMTLWDVDDDATTVFMDRFYQEMLENQLTPAAALRATQLWMQTESEYQAPDYWAGFVLQGEWQ